MSEWVMAEWRVAPRGRYAFAFLAIALMLSATLIGIAMAAVPDEGGFDDTHIELVMENWLTAVESLWVIPPYLGIVDGYDGDFERLDHHYPTTDLTVRWVVDSFFKLTARNHDLERRDLDYPLSYRLDGLLVAVNEKFGWMTVDGTYCAWDLRFDGNRIHFGSDTVDKPGHIPESHWTVSHDYSGSIEVWGNEHREVEYRAQLRFHLWFETEDPVF